MVFLETFLESNCFVKCQLSTPNLLFILLAGFDDVQINSTSVWDGLGVGQLIGVNCQLLF